MKSKRGLIVFIAACFLFGITLVYAQQDVYELKIEGGKFPPVQFTHAKHVTDYKIDCKVCHHKEADPQVKVQKCVECHDPVEVKNGACKAMEAYHKNCIDCHKKEGKAAPTKCNECHKKS